MSAKNPKSDRRGKAASLDARAESTWDRAEHAYGYYVSYLANKPHRFELSLVDLLHVKNFKGGSAIIAECTEELPLKLARLSKALREAHISGDFRKSLAHLDNKTYKRCKSRMVSFVKLVLEPGAHINGFGASFASALLHFFFPETVPILDRRGLNGRTSSGRRDPQKWSGLQHR